MGSSRSKKRKRQRLMISSYVSPPRPDLPGTFESLNDDTLSTILQFVGRKSYRPFGGINKTCKEIYLSAKGMRKETFLFGYGPLPAIKDKIDASGRFDWKLRESVSKGILHYNRRDVLAWVLQEKHEQVLKGICYVAAREERCDILGEVLNNVDDEDVKRFVFRDVDYTAACRGKLNVLKWFQTKGLSINKYDCAEAAARDGHIHIIRWLREEQGLKLYGELCNHALHGGCHLHVIKWLREQEVPWDDYTFGFAAEVGNLDILQWLHDEGCPWPDDRHYHAHERYVQPEVIDWCRVNGYSDRFVFED